MIRRLVLLIATAALLVGLAAPAALSAPADGNGKKFVDVVDELFEDAVDCGDGNLLDFHLVGAFQGIPIQGEGNKNLAVLAVNSEQTFINEDGDTFSWRDAGKDRFWINDDGNIVVELAGRVPDPFEIGMSVVGHTVIILDPDTFEVLELVGTNGNIGPTSAELACAALT